jgi:hypothetical protein
MELIQLLQHTSMLYWISRAKAGLVQLRYPTGGNPAYNRLTCCAVLHALVVKLRDVNSNGK